MESFPSGQFALKRLRIVILVLATLACVTWSAHASEIASCEPLRTLSLQSPVLSGTDVVELQLRLEQLGFGPLTPDGVFGPRTVAAVERFQRAKGLNVDGVVGASTWDALQEGALPAAGHPPAAPPKGALSIVVDTDNFKLTLYADGQPYKTYPVAVGRPSHFTLSPVGEWRVIYKGTNWGGGFGTRWLGLNVPWGIYGIHGTNKPWSIGTRASAGCIRMYNHDVEELYEWVPTGTPVTIRGVVPDVEFNRTLRTGMSGRDVVYVQFRLGDLGFDPKGADGRFGPDTERAVKEMQRLYGLPVDGQVYDDLYYLLGLKQ